MRINQLPDLGTPGDNDYLIVDTEAGTRKVKKKNIGAHVIEEGDTTVQNRDYPDESVTWHYRVWSDGTKELWGLPEVENIVMELSESDGVYVGRFNGASVTKAFYMPPNLFSETIYNFQIAVKASRILEGHISRINLATPPIVQIKVTAHHDYGTISNITPSIYIMGR